MKDRKSRQAEDQLLAQCPQLVSSRCWIPTQAIWFWVLTTATPFPQKGPLHMQKHTTHLHMEHMHTETCPCLTTPKSQALSPTYRNLPSVCEPE